MFKRSSRVLVNLGRQKLTLVESTNYFTILLNQIMEVLKNPILKHHHHLKTHPILHHLASLQSHLNQLSKLYYYRKNSPVVVKYVERFF
ncbi:hypothetical protein BpHYR1_042263 [Brachionus plicatilis]|uniref:Uncharacterized protein n=1 Tax=Brachionus plicatilis TaxID=10195 RepID=A0A3M7PQA8_BRAPC|nr:hypothetical protein BpHYR1_042263 [Brachionus plicatilis]